MSCKILLSGELGTRVDLRTYSLSLSPALASGSVRTVPPDAAKHAILAMSEGTRSTISCGQRILREEQAVTQGRPKPDL